MFTVSRFFATGDTTTESEYSESDVDIKDTKTAKKATVSRLIDSSDSDSDAPREIKSAKEKKVDELEKICTLVHNYLKRNEIAKTAETFDLLQKQLIKSAAIIKVSGVPPCFFKALLAIEEKTVDLSEDKETLSALAPASQKAVDPLKTKVRKIIALYAKQITAYKKAPLVSDEEEDDEDEDDESEDDEPVVQKKAAPAAVKAVAPARKSAFSMGSDSEEDDEESEDEVPVKKAPVTKAAPTSRFGFDDESESEEESDEEDYAGDTFVDSDDDDDWARAEETASEEESEDDFDYDNIKLDASKITRDFWVKKANHKDTNKKVQAKPKAAPKTRAQPKAKSSKFDDDDEKKVEAAPREEMTPQNLNKRLREIVANRGKRSTDNQAILAELLDLETQTKEVPTIVKILTLVLLTHFDIVLQHGSSMSVSVWRNVVGIVQRMLTILEQNPTVRLAEDDAYQDFQIYDQTDDEHGISLENFIDEDEREEYLNRRQRLRDENEAQRSKLSKLRAAERAAESSSEYTFVEGSLYSYVWKLSNEYFKSLQQADHLSSDFIARLREQPRLIELFKATRAYYQRTEKPVLETRVLHLWIEYEYYFYQPKYDVMGKTEEVPVSIVDELADILIKCDDARIRTRALLFQLYFWAIHNRYDAARDRYLASHIQESINDHDIETRVLYNRTVAQLGLAAFRQGDYRATVSALHELFANPSRTRELLAQGVCIPKTTEPREDDIAEARRRIYPYHMFIDIDLLEAVNLISCTIVEIPIIVECGWHQLRRVVSRSFRKLYLPFSQERSRHVYLQAETTKDAILIAAEALEKGRWAQCYESIRSLRFWTFIPQADLVKKQLEVRIKREALRTYLLTSGSNYISITMDILVSMFDLPESDIIRITSKMMHSDLISGTWDISGTSKIMTIQSTPQNTLQKSCFQWVDKVQQFSERVERLYDVRYPANKK